MKRKSNPLQEPLRQKESMKGYNRYLLVAQEPGIKTVGNVPFTQHIWTEDYSVVQSEDNDCAIFKTAADTWAKRKAELHQPPKQEKHITVGIYDTYTGQAVWIWIYTFRPDRSWEVVSR